MAPQGYAQQARLSGTSPQPLEARVDDLGQQIRILQRLRELAADNSAAAQNEVTPTASANDGRAVPNLVLRFQTSF